MPPAPGASGLPLPRRSPLSADDRVAALLETLPDDAVEVAGRAHRLGDHGAEDVTFHGEQRRRLHRPYGGDPGGVAKDRDLAEELPSRERPERARLPVRFADDLDLAVDDDEELVRGGSLPN